MQKLNLTVREMCEILEAEPVGVSAAVFRRKVKLCLDSRQVEKGCVFWPICGERFDAHQFVEQAQNEGAIMSVVNENKVSQNTIQAYVPVKDTTEALLKLAKGYQRRFSLKKVAITGSNGKTTTKEMIRTVLSRKYKTMATEGNFNNHIGVPLTLFRLKHSDQVAVVEMGTSGPDEIRPLSLATEPNIGVITNIGASHLEKLKSLEGVFHEKMNLTAGLQENGLLVVNADDPYLAKVRSTKRYKVTTFGIRRGILKPENLQFDENACASFRIGRIEYRLNVPGIHNVYNALAAIAVGEAMRIPKAEIAKALAGFAATGMRMEIRNANGFRVVSDCYNANPSSTRMALQTIGNLSSVNHRVAILGDMLELGSNSKNLHFEIGQMVPECNFDLLLTIGECSKEIQCGALKNGMRKECALHFENLQELELFISENLGFDDVILVKGSRGMRLEKVVDALLKMDVVGV